MAAKYAAGLKLKKFCTFCPERFGIFPPIEINLKRSLVSAEAFQNLAKLPRFDAKNFSSSQPRPHLDLF